MGTVLVTGGTGHVGSYAVYFLARSHGIEKLVFVGRNEDMGRTVKNNATTSAALAEFYPEIIFRKIDLRDVEQTTELLKDVRPDVILNSTAAISAFPYHGVKMRARSPYGFSLVKDLVTLYPLLKSVKKTCPKTPVVNVTAPDNAHYIMSQANLGPVVGAGTIDLTVQGVRQVAAERLKIPMHNVNATMVAHVALRGNPPIASSKVKIPYYVKIIVGDKDLTDKLDIPEIICEGVHKTFHIKNITNAALTAASAVRNTLAILYNTGELRHGAGINGMVGGTPIRLSRTGAEMILPEGLTREDIFEMNMVGFKNSGIEKIKNDGTIVYTDEAVKRLEEALGLSWKEVKLKDLTSLADEYVAAFKDSVEKSRVI